MINIEVLYKLIINYNLIMTIIKANFEENPMPAEKVSQLRYIMVNSMRPIWNILH